ncbi:MAG: hypothetical protein ACXVCV_04685 [Polyangia bacterium]
MKKLVLGITLVLLCVVGWRAYESDAPDATLLFHRFWIDHEPRDEHEKFSVFFVNGEIPFGHFGTRTMWTAQLEFFHYHLVPREAGTIDLLFGATRERQRVHYVARRCNERGFDYCLEIAGSSRGVQRYYSKKEWEIKSGESLDQLAERALAR